MLFDKFDPESLRKERHEAVAKSVRTINAEELKKLGDQLFPNSGDPWRTTFFQFVADHPGETFHHAVTSDGVTLLYSRGQDRGLWFVAGTGMGPLPERGRALMKEVIERPH